MPRRRTQEGSREGRHLLWRTGHAHARGVRVHPQADDPDRQPADPLAHHEVLRPLRVHTDFVLCLGYKADVIKQLLPQLQRGDGERLRAVRGRREGPPAQDGHPQLEHHVRGHGPAREHRHAPARRARAPRRRRVLPRELRRHAHRRRPAGDDRAREGGRRDRELPRRAAELQLPRRRHGRRRLRRRRPRRHALRRLDQRRLLRPAQGRVRPHRARARTSSTSRSRA